MKQGSLPEHNLEKSVLKEIKKNTKANFIGAGVGNDYSCINNLVSSEGIGDTPVIAWNKAFNNFLCSGAICEGVRILLLLPTCIKESQIKSFMSKFNSLAQEAGIQILGGHSEISEAFLRPKFVVNVFGKSNFFVTDKKNINPEFDIVMVGFSGLLGTNLIIDKYKSRILERFSKYFVEEAFFDESTYSIRRAVNIIMDDVEQQAGNICYLHDISSGGVYSALWQLGEWMGKGFLIDNKNIPIKQHTIELCELFDCNPYLLEGTGGLLLVCDRGRDIVCKLREENIEANIIGKITDSKERLICLSENDIRTLAPVCGDEFYNIK